MRDIDINSTQTDSLSAKAHELLTLDHTTAYRRLIVRGEGNEQARPILHAASPKELVLGPVASDDDARALLSGLWLWHDWLDQSHVISQQLKSATGSFWHAIMHRREGDFSNSKYWYARCTGHPVLQTMGPFATDVLRDLPADNSLLRLVMNGWDPEAFVDLVEVIHDNPTDRRTDAAIHLQRLEWRLLFDHCMRQASGQ